MSGTVRPAVAADAERLGAYGLELTALHHHWDPDRFIDASHITPSAYAGVLARQVDKPDSVLLVVESDGVVLGYCWGALEGYDYMALRGPVGQIYDIFIHEGRRREGFGRMLLDATIAALGALGAPQVVLKTAARNEAGQRLFASAGLRPTMIEMTLSLKPGAEG